MHCVKLSDKCDSLVKTFLAARCYEHIAQKYMLGCVNFYFSQKMLHIRVVMAQLVNRDSTVLITHSSASVRVCNLI